MESQPVKKYGALSSSVNPKELSLTVQAGVRTVLSLGVMVGIISTTGADVVVEQVPALVAAAYGGWQLIEFTWGAVRKIIVAISKKD